MSDRKSGPGLEQKDESAANLESRRTRGLSQRLRQPSSSQPEPAEARKPSAAPQTHLVAEPLSGMPADVPAAIPGGSSPGAAAVAETQQIGGKPQVA